MQLILNQVNKIRHKRPLMKHCLAGWDPIFEHDGKTYVGTKEYSLLHFRTPYPFKHL